MKGATSGLVLGLWADLTLTCEEEHHTQPGPSQSLMQLQPFE